VTDLLPQTREQARPRSSGRRACPAQPKRRLWRAHPVVQFITVGLAVLAVLVLATWRLAGRTATAVRGVLPLLRPVGPFE
jgi:type VI protein secretion system component VasF